MRARLPSAILLLLFTGAAAALEEQEQRDRIAFETAKFEQQIEHSGILFDDPALDAYLQEVTDRMFPEMQGKLRVRTFRDPEFNAFAVATGGIYFHTGALLRLNDEAQLASVLGHEGTHVVADHVYRHVKSAKSASVVAAFGALLAVGFGVPIDLVGIIAYSTMAGFSRSFERESDRGGFDRMVAEGYDARGGAEAFARLARELEMRHMKRGPYFFASHPNVQDRVTTLMEFGGESPPPGERGADRYLAVTLGARLNAVEQIHRAGNGKVLVFLLEDENLLPTLPPHARFYLADGFRLRAEKSRRESGDGRSEKEKEAQRIVDAQRAVQEYERTILEAPGFAPTWQALALHHHRAGDKARALALFRRYVELEPDPRQSGYARQYIESLSKELGP
ncbi:MAG TPA: M48 family metalloprotease [Steroidobacteraceae bacterium]|nr:M48 family metalloprotease [Steroidobacteraceae bacterium]